MASNTFNPAVDGNDFRYQYADGSSSTLAGNSNEYFFGTWDYDDVHLGLRFNTSNLNQGAVINSAVLTLDATIENWSTDNVGHIFGVAVNSPAPFATTNPVTSLSANYTTNSVLVNSSNYNNFNVANIIQELVDRPGFNGYIQLVFVSETNDDYSFFYSESIALSDFDLSINWTNVYDLNSTEPGFLGVPSRT